jgi:four helix bundle protein
VAGFEDLEVWKRASRLCVNVYKSFSACRDFGFKDQVTRAAVSLPSNIAEGSERGSDKEFARFLRIAKGSAGELRTQLYIANELGYLTKAAQESLVDEVMQISKMMQGLISACEGPCLRRVVSFQL